MKNLFLVITFLVLSVLSQNNPVDYWVDLTNNGAYVSIGAADYGRDGQLSVSWVFKVGNIQSGWHQVFHSYSNLANDGADSLRLGVAIQNGNVFGLHLGTQFHSWPLGAQLANGVTYSMTMDLVNSGTNLIITVYVNNGQVLSASIPNESIGAGIRVNTILGAYRYSTGALVNHIGAGSDTYLDNFIILTKVSTSAFRGSLFAQLWRPTVDVAADIRLWLSFDDTVSGVGDTTVAITSASGEEAIWVNAEFIGGAVFKQHVDTSLEYCYGWGDPHIYLFGSGAHFDGGEQLQGHYLMVGCDEADYEFRTFTRYTQWWQATVYRSIAIRYRDSVYRFNLDEISTSSGGSGFLGVAAGAFFKTLQSTSWEALPQTGGNYVFFKGAYYMYNSNTFGVNIPGVAQTSLSTPDWRYMNIDTWFNTLNTNCPRTGEPASDGRGYIGKEGYCYGDMFYRRVDYEDWLPPPPHQDINIPADPCQGVASASQTKIKDQCKRIYPTNNDLYSDCVIDGCLSGDPEIIPLTTPTPECQVSRLLGVTGSCADLDCPNQCSYRGVCSNKVCTCDAGWVGKDCGQPKYFACQSFTYDNVETYISPLQLLSTQTLNQQFNSIGIERSLLLYSVNFNNAYYLFAVASRLSSPYSGSFQLCFDSPINVQSTVAISVTASGNNCYDFSFGAYQQGGAIFDLGTGPTAITYNLKVSNKKNIDQVLFGDANGVKNLEISKIPNAYQNSFTYKVNQCDSEVCSLYEKCSECAAQPQCGYCLETNRCMLGTSSGPLRSVCRNWRFSYDDPISRVVTVDYQGADLVTPDYEIFLAATGSQGVSTAITVPTGSSNDQWDVAFFFQTTGTYPIYASSLKNNFMKILESSTYTSMSLNIAIGNYDESKAVATQQMTRLSTNNHYVFARALETTTGTGTNLNGGQIGAIGFIAGGNAVNLGFRKYSKKLAVLTVYDTPTASDFAKLAATKDSLIKSNILPVVIAMGASADSVEDYFRNTVPNDVNGFPIIVLRMDEAGSDFANVFSRIFQLGSSAPYVALDKINDDLTHLNQVSVDASRDVLYYIGLTNQVKAKFILPMKRGDGNHHKAKIRVPGYGEATIVDVDNGKPVGSAYTFHGDENSPCIQITLSGTTFKNLLPPVFHFVSTVPTNKGALYVFDSTKPGANGLQVTNVSYHGKNTFCFRPTLHDYSYPVGSIYTSFTYYVSDGCANSPSYVVDIVVNPVLEAPASHDYIINLFEGENNNFTIEAFEYDKDLTTNVDEKVTFNYKYIASYNRPDLFSKIDTTTSFREMATQTPISFTTPYGPLTTTSNKVTQDLSYVTPSDDFFGQINYGFTVTDTQNLANTYKITINITPINDDPVAIYEPIVATKEDTPITVTLQGFDIDNYGPTLTYKIISLQNATLATIKNAAGATLTIGKEYSYTEANSHKVEVKLTLNPSANDNNCPEGTVDFKTCPGSYAVIQFKVNDNNKEYRTSKSDATIFASETSWQTMTVHVVAVNDRPNTPADKVLNLVEDQFDNIMTLTAEDIDTVSTSLDVFIEHLPSYKSLHIFQRLAGGAKGAEITSDITEINDFTKKRFLQDHGLFVTPDPNVHGVKKSDGFFFDSFTYYSWDRKLRSDSATVRVNIRPVNDAPVPLASVQFLEDNNYTLTFEAGDVDNLESELNYTIIALPDLSKAEEGVYVYFVDSTGSWNLISTKDLPYSVPRVNGRATVILTPRLNWFGATKLTYTTKDVDNFLSPGDVGYIVNTIPQDLTITVMPVNDAPVLKISSPMGNEDTPIVITLAGDDDAWGEDDQLEAILESELYDGNGRSVTLGQLYLYTSALYTQLVANINNLNGAVEVHMGSIVDEKNEYKVIYVPRQHKNTDTTLPHLAINPWFDYKVHEKVSANEPKGLSSPVGSIKIVVSSINDAPVAWGNAWTTISEYDSIYGINAGVWNNPSNPSTPGQTNVCYDTCFYFEDFGVAYPTSPAHRGIYMGGQDIELSDLSVVIVDANCPDTIEIFYVEADGTEKQLKNTELKGWKYTQTIAPGSLRSVLQFRPAMDDFNAENPDENRGGRATDGGHKGSSFCTITYEVRDEDDTPSVETKTITITVMQKNDIPREKLDRPTDNSNSNAQIDLSNFVVNNLIGFEDVPLIFKLDAYDVEGDDFTVKIFDCEKGNGRFYGPSTTQHTLINAEGELELPKVDPLVVAFDTTTEIDCAAAKSEFVTLSTKFSETEKKGWYMLFVPEPNDNGVNYNKLSLIYDDGISPVDTIYGTFRFITILPVNDAPEIWINSPSNGTSIPISYDDNDRIILDPLNYKDDVHIDGKENLGTTVDTPYNFNLTFQDDDAFDSPLIDFEIKITSRPKKEQDATAEPGYFTGFPDNVASAVVQKDSIKWTSTIAQANQYVATLTFVGDKQGEYTMTVTVNDNGFTGKHCPPGPKFSLGQRSCPRTSVATFTINSVVNSAMLAGIATGVGGGIVALTAIGALLGAKFLKPKDTDAWTEWDVDNFGDVALPNPLFKGETVTGTSQIYTQK